MASGSLTLVHSVTGQTKTAPTGFSWTTLFFGFFPALLRGHIWNAMGQFFLALITGSISLFIVPFFYNQWYVDYLTKNGYRNPNMPNYQQPSHITINNSNA